MRLTACGTWRAVAVVLGASLVYAGAAGAKDVAPTEAEAQALAGLRGRIGGRIVWESNRSGEWELYTMNADGSGARQLTRLASPDDPTAYNGYLRPQFSPDGRRVMFGYGHRGGPPQVWWVSSDGGGATKLTDGDPLNWTPDGKGIYFVRDSALMVYDIVSGQERRVDPATLPADGKDIGMVGTVRADLSSVALRAPKANEVFVLAQAETVRTTSGCQVRFTASGSHLYWVQGPRDFRTIDMATGEERPLLGQPATDPYNYTYFPTISDDEHWLLYGASPSQHDHDTSDYEVYVVALEGLQPSGAPTRLTFNDKTDRWPYLGAGIAPLEPMPTPTIRVFEGERDSDLVVRYAFGDEAGPAEGEREAPVSAPIGVATEDGTLHVPQAALVATEDPAEDIANACAQSGEVSVEAVIQPGSLGQNGPARIVTLSSDPYHRDFTLGQDGDRYIFRLRSTTTGENGVPDLQAPAGSATDELTHLLATRDSGGTLRLYVNGQEVASRQDGGDLSNWDRGFRLALANELTSDRPWVGDIRMANVYARCLSADEARERSERALGR